MLILLALPALLATSAAHRYLARYAPSNVLIRKVQNAPPRLRTVAALTVWVVLLILALRGVELAIAAGAPSGLNLMALCIGWDAVKVTALTAQIAVRCLLEAYCAVSAHRSASDAVSSHSSTAAHSFGMS